MIPDSNKTLKRPIWSNVPRSEVEQYIAGKSWASDIRKRTEETDKIILQKTVLNLDNNWEESGKETVLRYTSTLGNWWCSTSDSQNYPHLARFDKIPYCSLLSDGSHSYVVTIRRTHPETISIIEPHVRAIRDIPQDYHYDLKLPTIYKIQESK